MKHLLLGCMLAVSLPLSAQRNDVPVESGAYSPTWESVSAWSCPTWFEDAKFGIWAHWGPQCEAEDGDWYARFMYYPNTQQWNWQTSHFGSPKTFGLKDLIHVWKAEKWNPDRLVKLYKDAGARYFMTLGNHHDNFDLWDSPYQEWNSVNMGPKQDIVKGWSDACKKYGLPLGVSIHASHAWTWLEPSQPYDGNLTKEDGYKLNDDGTEKWWKGYDPQELYAQRHEHSTGWDNSGTIHSQWAWGNGASIPSKAYMTKFQNRVLQLVNDYSPQMLYFDDTVLPFYGVTDSVGLNILAGFYNHSARLNGGEQQAVVMGKILDEKQKDALLWDVERGIPDRPQKRHWQTCTCIGDWHYSQGVYQNNGYKSAAQVVRMLIDIVSKNGNLLLNVPVKADGTIDEKEEAVVKAIGAWMNVNGKSIYGTRPWKTFGEGPMAESANPLNAQGFNENNNYTSRDVRYVERNDTVYATVMAWPSGGEYGFKAFGVTSGTYSGKVTKVELLGQGEVKFRQDSHGLYVDVPTTRSNNIAPVFQITLGERLGAWEHLQELVNAVESELPQLTREANYNTGKYNRLQLARLEEQLETARKVTENDGADRQQAAIDALSEEYQELVNKRNEGGTASLQDAEDLTVAQLKEAAGFSRIDQSSTRFSTPKYWIVENFKVTQNNADGTKNGIDRYPGFSCLMLGVWDDRQNSQEGDLTNARVYQKVHLSKGRYYFGGAFETHYNLSEGYIFASQQLSATNELPSASLACYPVSKVSDGNDAYGVYFTLPKDGDVFLGFQADLAHGSATQELRVRSVKLLKYADVTYEQLQQKIASAKSLVDGVKVGENTGNYTPAAVAAFRAHVDKADRIDASADEATLYDAYATLEDALQRFTAEGRCPGGTGGDEGGVNVTTEYLIEAAQFSPAEGEGKGSRFAAPKYWTVENYNIPQTDGSGTKAGLDNYTGQYSLMLGLWDDRARNTEGNLSDARIYRKLSLPKGRYYFGAGFDNTWVIPLKSYIFVADRLLPTADIGQQATACYDMTKCTKDGVFNGVYFSLDRDMEVYVGFQCDLTYGSEQQEFRVKSVKLVRLDGSVTGISTPVSVIAPHPADGYYTLAGVRMKNAPKRGACIVRRHGMSKVVLVR